MEINNLIFNSRFKDLHMKIKVVGICFVLGLLFQQGLCDCKLREHADDPATEEHEKELLKKIEPLKGKQFTDTSGNYTYKVKICDRVDGQKDNFGAIQIQGNDVTSLGKFDKADIMGGKNWILLTYFEGEAYKSHCNSEERTTQIIIICDENKGDFNMLEEKRKKANADCSYWFELGDKVACTEKHEQALPHGMSSGGVFCIIFFTFFGAYFTLGFLYKRLVVGSKGIEQIPNYSFWRSFGNLQADACDYVCRCGPRQETHGYRGIDDPLKTEEHDDQLLNM